jgi:hypothetical protein
MDEAKSNFVEKNLSGLAAKQIKRLANFPVANHLQPSKRELVLRAA